MEIIAASQNSFKIRSKNTSFIINPGQNSTKGETSPRGGDADVVILTSLPTDYSVFEGKLVISGPGEFEVAGVSIRSEKMGESISYTLLEENQSLLILPSAKKITTEESEGVTATVILLDAAFDSSLNISSEIVVVVSPPEFLPEDKLGIKKIDKINLKKIEEFKGTTVYLSK